MMEFEHEFAVPLGIDETFRALCDLELVGACLPGAVVTSVVGDEASGHIAVKLGSMNLSYAGTAERVTADPVAHVVEVVARARQLRGASTAEVRFCGRLTTIEGGTQVAIDSRLDITGRPAQMGRSVIASVGDKVVNQFADALVARLSSMSSEGDESAPELAATAGVQGANEAPLDLSRVVGAVILDWVRQHARVIAASVLVITIIAVLAFT